MTKKQVSEVVTIFLAAYPNLRALGKKVLDGLEAVWVPMLADIPLEVGQLAAQQVLTEQTIPAFPAIGRIRQAAARIMLGKVPTAIEAWAQVDRATSKFSDNEARKAYDALSAFSPIAARVIVMMGWFDLYWGMRGERYGLLRHEFMVAYDKEVERQTGFLAMLPQVRQRIGVEPLPAPQKAIEAAQGDAG